MTESNPSAAAHAETEAHHASVRKACAFGCGTGTTCGSGGCQAAARLAALEASHKRMRITLWSLFFIGFTLIVFYLGQRAQYRREMGPNPGQGFMQRGPKNGEPMPSNQDQRPGQQQGRRNAQPQSPPSGY